MAEKKKKVKKWIQPQHKVVIPLLRGLLKPVMQWMYGLQVD